MPDVRDNLLLVPECNPDEVSILLYEAFFGSRVPERCAPLRRGAAISRMERTHTREDRSHAGAAQTTAATHSHAFPAAAAESAQQHTADSLRRSISFALPNSAFAPCECACNHTSTVKRKQFISGLLTSGSYVRIRTGEPVCFCEHLHPWRMLGID